MGYGYWPRYVTVAEKQAKAKRKIKQLRKKNPDICPVILEGKALATTWWGKAWNKNLERYADYTNRIGRGRSYVRHMAVVDLKIKPGRVDALVQGTRGAPYKVVIKIAEIKQKNWQEIKKKCLTELSSLPDLLAGKFPKKLQEVFMVQGRGLFPTPAEISFDCSCPDWADMCKHVAATLYGVGARLDEDPALFFTLRKMEMAELVEAAVQDKTAAILKDTKTAAGTRVIDDDEISGLFGLDIDVSLPKPAKANKQTGKKTAGRKKTSKKGAGTRKIQPTKKSTVRSKPAAAKTKTKMNTSEPCLPAGYGSAADLILGCLEESGADGLSVQELAEITGIPARKLYPILGRLKKQGRLHRPRRAVYCFRK